MKNQRLIYVLPVARAFHFDVIKKVNIAGFRLINQLTYGCIKPAPLFIATTGS